MMKTLFKKSSKKANKENRTRVKCKDQSELKGQQMTSGRGGHSIMTLMKGSEIYEDR